MSKICAYSIVSYPLAIITTMSNGTDLNQVPEEHGVEGGRRHNKTKSNKNVIIVGKVYADWCGHCQMLKPEWAKMKKHMYSQKGKKRVVFVEIEEKEIESKLRKLEEEQGVTIQADGYPTLFRIANGKVKYYGGNRQSHAMTRWFLKGGDPEKEEEEVRMPGLLEDQQGGRRPFRRTFRRTRRSFDHSNKRYFNQYKEPYQTRRRNHDRVPKKSPGFLDFLFGK